MREYSGTVVRADPVEIRGKPGLEITALVARVERPDHEKDEHVFGIPVRSDLIQPRAPISYKVSDGAEVTEVFVNGTAVYARDRDATVGPAKRPDTCRPSFC